MEIQPENNEPRRHHFFCTHGGSALATGIAVGVGIGVAMNNIALGIAIGIALFIGEDIDNRHR